MPYPEKPDQPKSESLQRAATSATPAAAPKAAEKPKSVEDTIKDAKAAASKAPDGDLKDEATRGVEAAEALLADGHSDRAMTAARQAQALLKTP
jgi:hypothetical protein